MVESLLAGGAERLALERQSTDWGAAKEAAVLAALRLLGTAFDLDAPLVEALRHSEHTGEPCISFDRLPHSFAVLWTNHIEFGFYVISVRCCLLSRHRCKLWQY